MSILYLREQISDSIGFTKIIDPKFKTNTINLKLFTELKEETASVNSIVAGILGSSNSKYKNLTELTAKLNSLYGADIGVNVVKRGDIQVMSISISAIDNSYALNGEDITGEVLDIFLDCLFSPYVEDGGFGQEIFTFRKKDLLESIDSEINNKRRYAILQAQKYIFEGEPSAYSSYGTRKTAEKITPVTAYEAYKEIIKTSQIEIYYVGAKDNPIIKDRLASAFSGLDRKPLNIILNSTSAIKKEVKDVIERVDVSQSKMVMAFKTEYTDLYAIKLMSTLLGETPFSKLFANVREKLSLCYYCASGFNDSKGTLMIDSGVENVNVEKARVEILNQLDDIKKGNFTDEEMSNSVLSILNSFKGVSDTPASLINWYFSRFCRGEIINPDEEINRVKAVTREQIIEAAKSFKLDTVYVMTGEEE